jgi:hypothetical protein
MGLLLVASSPFPEDPELKVVRAEVAVVMVE